MAVFETDRASHESPSILGRLGRAITRAAGTVAAWNDRRVTRKALSQLSDRELQDIGLCRGDIARVARTGR
ncbi:DUF1127 domain-containing protein [Roseovarius salinarum]|uniref:DUF1127 domain-containing protein n=1 Tax=Roseovarius salinarum TaxID=1981892 RepID=UPI000C33D12A|nr:DUF1127 domain-containing protein [Roseovarius salinarum]